ncbi:MAG: fasciclin domain-containing protein [Myxococcaceae bacterium]
MNKVLLSATLLMSLTTFAEGKSTMTGTKPAATATATATKDIIDTAVAAGSFKTLATALTEAGLIETLKGTGPFTVFAPTDEAFAKIAKKDLDALLKDKKKLVSVLTYHVVPGKVSAADVLKMKDGSKVKTVEGREFTLALKSGKVMVDGANVTATDVAASNGVIHVIDTVIMPK